MSASWIELYSKQLPISNKKKADLVSLLATGTILACYNDYYNSLPSSGTVTDCLPDPAAEEVDEDVAL